MAHAKLDLSYIDVNGLSTLDRQFLVERQIISRELATGEGPRGVAVSSLENIAIMVNEEDHLRVQFMLSGFRLPEVWDAVNQLDDQLEEQLGLRVQPAARLPDRLPHQRGDRHPGRRHASPSRPGPDQADRQGLPRSSEDQPGRPRPLRRREPGFRRLLPDLQPADAGQERARADQDPD